MNNNDNDQAAGSEAPFLMGQISRRRMLQRTGPALAALGFLGITGFSKLQTIQVNERNSMMAQNKNEIYLFRVNIPEEALTDLRRRIAATRWPDQETVSDRS